MLTSAQIESFDLNGYLLLSSFATDSTVLAIAAKAESDLAAGIRPVEREADLGYPGAPESRDAPGGMTVRRLLQAYDRDRVFASWAENPELVSCIGNLVHSDRVFLTRAHHNCVMTKMPGYSSDTGWHQDIRYWRFSDANLVNAWLALTPESPENGGLRVIPKSHHWRLGADDFDSERFLQLRREPLISAARNAVSLRLNPGDLLLFSAGLFHCAGRNHTDATKLSLVFSFHGEGTTPIADTRSAAIPEIEVTAGPETCR